MDIRLPSLLVLGLYCRGHERNLFSRLHLVISRTRIILLFAAQEAGSLQLNLMTKPAVLYLP